ncbi:MAG: cupin domain-containing protein [Lentisphaeria bacterium]|nr:cupin domain-containing protein [Lentisphaeria bacterium]
MSEKKRYTIADFTAIEPVECPCGLSRRAYIEASEGKVSFHRLDVKIDAQLHYHKEHEEIYYILEGEGFLELDGEKIPVKPGSSVMIHPYCRHRAIGKLKVINVSLPSFDMNDEFFD